MGGWCRRCLKTSCLPKYSCRGSSRCRGVPRQGWFNRISQLSADFLILNPDTSVVAAIELDEASHGSPSRRDADARKTRALQSAGVKLIRWHVKSLPDEASIRAAIAPNDVPMHGESAMKNSRATHRLCVRIAG